MGLYQHIGLAVAFSPRLKSLLAEVSRCAPFLGHRLTLLHVGSRSSEKEQVLQTSIREAGLPAETPVLWLEGTPDDVILRAIEEQGIDLLFAGALEKEKPLKYFLGSVALNLVRESPSSLFLFTEPRLRPQPFESIVVLIDYSDVSTIAFYKTLRFAEQDKSRRIIPLRVVPSAGEVMALADGARQDQLAKYTDTTLAEEEDLLRDFIDAAGMRKVDVEPFCITGHPGTVTAQFVRDVQADLLVMPSADHSSHIFERVFPSDMEWILREIPCNLWVVRHHSIHS